MLVSKNRINDLKMERTNLYFGRCNFFWSWEESYPLNLFFCLMMDVFLSTDWRFCFESSVCKPKTKGCRKFKSWAKYFLVIGVQYSLGGKVQTHPKNFDQCSDLDSVENYTLLKLYTAKLIEICIEILHLTNGTLESLLYVNQVSVMASE